MSQKTALIIGAGPAGLTASFEFLKRTDILPIVLEKGDFMGGISRTVLYKGNRMDIGGHRFFSKSDRVMDWWTAVMPVQARLRHQQAGRAAVAAKTAPLRFNTRTSRAK